MTLKCISCNDAKKFLVNQNDCSADCWPKKDSHSSVPFPTFEEFFPALPRRKLINIPVESIKYSNTNPTKSTLKTRSKFKYPIDTDFESTTNVFT